MHKKNRLKAVLAIAVALAFVMPVAAFANNEKPDELNNIINTESLDFTHTVFAEFGTTSGCPYCAPVSGYLYSIYSSGNYDFYYLTLNVDKETLASDRYWELPAGGYVPTVWFDGGYSWLIGNHGSTTPYEIKITASGSRSVADIDLEVVVDWRGNAEMEVTVNVTNNEGSNYNGHLHTYITEITSRWNDYSGKPYHFSMIGYAFNEGINVDAGDTWSDTATWDGDSHGYGDITKDNIMVIATVFNSSNNYADETSAATPNGNHPPDKPRMPSGPTIGIVGVEYTYTSSTTDLDGDDVCYLFDWDDGTNSGWLGPYNSGYTVEASHTWNDEGIYDIKVKAKDMCDEESNWSDPLVINILVDRPVLEIGDISGGLLKIKAVIKNRGGIDATSADWIITLDGGFILLGREKTGGIINIPAGGEVTVSSGLICGFGRTVITVSAECAEGSSDTKTQDAFVLLFFIKIRNA